MKTAAGNMMIFAAPGLRCHNAGRRRRDSGLELSDWSIQMHNLRSKAIVIVAEATSRVTASAVTPACPRVSRTSLRRPNTAAAARGATLVLAMLLLTWPQRADAQSCPYVSPVALTACTNIKLGSNCRAAFLDLANFTLGQTTDLMTPAATVAERAQATTLLDVCEPLQTDAANPDFGEDWSRRLIARFAYRDLFGMSDSMGADALEQEAIAALTTLQRSDYGAMGTDTPVDCSNKNVPKTVLCALEKYLSDVDRKGDGDIAMQGLTTVLNRYGSRIPTTVFNHVLNDLIDLSPGPGSVETLSYGANSVTEAAACVAAAASCGPFALFCGAGCIAAVNAERVEVPETENHITNIYVLQYLKNQTLFNQTNNPAFDNAHNGYRNTLLNRLKGFVRNDFVEYNAHNYQDYEMWPLLNLYSYAQDSVVKGAAKMTLDYISAKVVASSDQGRRSTPFRRHNDVAGGYFCDEVMTQHCADPQTAWYMQLAGVTDILQNNSKQDWTVPASPAGAPADAALPDNNLPETNSVEFQIAASASYTIDPLLQDLFVNPQHQTYYQFLHYTNQQRLSGSMNSNDELYFRSPSYLISAGGHPTDYAYVADIPWPISLIIGSFSGQDDDLGVATATTLMPTGTLHSRVQMIRFSDPGGENLCVWRNFACGLNPVIPGNYMKADPGSIPAPPGSGTWSFFDQSGGHVGPSGGPCTAANIGYFAAVYQQDGFGFLEAYDTCSNPQGLAKLNDFATRVYNNNAGYGSSWSQTGVNTYKVVAGNVIQFTADAHIVSADGNPPYDPNRTNGDIINNDGNGVVTIKNPFTGATLTLDASVPPGHPSITVPGPVNFPDTCVGTSSYATLNVCNDTTGTDGLSVYNILPQNTAVAVTEPSSGYPTSIGPNFCFPFQAQFTPVAPGALSSSVTISNSDPIVPELKVAVTGKGIQQAIATVISNSGNFGDVCAGTYTDLNLTINNNGGCDLIVSNIVSSSADFTVAGTVMFPLTIHAGGSLAVPIRFHPLKPFGAKMGNITVSSNDPYAPSVVVPVSGNTPPPVINATIANNGAFGNVCAGTQEDLTLQVVNQGQCDLTISGISAISSVPSFVLPSVTNFPLVLSANATVNLPVRFQPAAFGSPNYQTCSNTAPQMANVVIHSDDPRYLDPIGFVTGVNGIEGCPKLVLSPQNLTGAFAFPATVSDPNGTLGCYTDRQITVSNAGICPLNIVGLTTANGLDGKGSPLAGLPREFNVTNPTVPVTIAPGATPVPVTIRFKPVILTDQSSSAPDQQTGTLSIVSNDPIPADNGAGLCGEPAYHSGVRVLVDNATGTPINPLKSLSLSSKGLKPNISQTLSPAIPVTAPNICGNSITYTLDNEGLPPAGTTGNNPLASYLLSAKQGSTQANVSFTLGPCELKSIIMQIK